MKKKEILTVLFLLIFSAIGTSKFIGYIEDKLILLQEKHYISQTLENTKRFLTFIKSEKEIHQSIEESQNRAKIEKYLQEEKLSLLILIEHKSKAHATQAIRHYSFDDYTILSFNTKQERLDFVKKQRLDYLINTKTYHLIENHLISKIPLKDIAPHLEGDILLIKSIDTSNYQDIHTLLKILHIIVFLVLLLAIIFVYRFRQKKNEIDKQRKHFKDIINTTSDIIIVTDKYLPIDVNRAFFKFFDEYDNLEAFNKAHGSIANLFIKEEGYISQQMGVQNWIEYIYHHQETEHQVKIVSKNKEYIFAIKIQALSHHKTQRYSQKLYTIVLTNITKIQEYQHELENISKTDMLTKLGNMNSFNEQLTMEIARAKRHMTELTLIIFDIDNLKKVNKMYGRLMGDKLLINVAHVIQDLLRTSDVFCRYKSDEFMVILSKTDKAGGVILAQRIVEKIEAIVIDKLGSITASIGVTELLTDDDAKTFVQRVNQALQKAQKSQDSAVEAF